VGGHRVRVVTVPQYNVSQALQRMGYKKEHPRTFSVVQLLTFFKSYIEFKKSDSSVNYFRFSDDY
jgi:hypothetical protein